MIIDDDYLTSESINQSKLKKILAHPLIYKNYKGQSDEDEPAEATLIGDGVDMILTQSKEKYDEKFLVTSIEKPSSKLGDFVWSLYQNRHNSDAEMIAYRDAGFSIDISIVRKNFKEKGKDYYDMLIASENQKVISPSEHNTILQIVESFKNSPFTKKYFKETDNIKIFTQVAIEFTIEHNGTVFHCKALLDMVIVNISSGEIIPVDIKTTGFSLNSWEDQLFKFRYDFQSAWYITALKSINLVERFGINMLFGEPVVKDFIFLVESQKFPGNPLIFEIDSSIVDIGTNGGVYKGTYYEGYKQALDRLIYHVENDKWDYKMEDYENNGVRRVVQK
jgi:hypothetical protein